jgi:hypothetical protein
MGQDDGDLPSHGQPEAQAAMSIRDTLNPLWMPLRVNEVPGESSAHRPSSRDGASARHNT